MIKGDIQEIMRVVPHRYPFLLVDRVLDYQIGESLTAIKNVSINEEYFVGHFPNMPIMPGVLMIEALGQAAGLLIFYTEGLSAVGYNGYVFAGTNQVRFKRIVEPGDQLKLFVKVLKRKKELWIFQAEASVDNMVACVAELLIIKSTKEAV